MNTSHHPLFLSLAALFLAANAAFADGRPLLKNADLEAAKDGATPDHWGLKAPAQYLEEGGNHFIRLSVGEPGKMVMLYREIGLPKETPYASMDLTFKARVTGLKRGAESWFDARIMFDFMSADKKKTGSGHVNFGKSTDGWVEKSKHFAIPAGTSYIKFMPCLFNAKAGTFDLDDIQITLQDEGQVGPEPKKAAPPRQDLFQVPEGLGIKAPVEKPLLEKDTLHVDGNRLVNAAGEEVWLQGVAVPSLGWSSGGEHVRESIAVAVGDWNANCVRLSVHSKYWLGEDGLPPPENYKKTVDDVIEMANLHGCYVVLDLHEYKAPTERHAAFWKDAAARYANRPGVLFDLLNEPHGISWDEWKNGGKLSGEKREGVVDENNEAKDVKASIGMQKLIEVVRATGAKNIVVCGGLDWAYDLSGVLNGYELEDPAGNGVMYSTHIYPWKGGWAKKVLACAEKHPIFVGEVGAMDKPMPWEKKAKDPVAWSNDMLSCIQKYKLNWTAWSFHPSASPVVISDWKYTPTACWGVFAREALLGKKFDSETLR